MVFKKTKDGWISEHFHIDPLTTYVEFMLPDGRYMYYEFEPNHQLREKLVWLL